MVESKQDGLLEQRLRRDADACREVPSPERRDRILAALTSQERAPAGWPQRGLLVAAALLLALGWIVFGLTAGDIQQDPVANGTPVNPGSGPTVGVHEATRVAAASDGPNFQTARVGERMSEWAASSSLALRANVDDPLARELRALSLDLGLMLDTVLVDLPAALVRVFGPVVTK